MIAKGRAAELAGAPDRPVLVARTMPQDSLKLSTQPEPHGRTSLSSPRTPRGTEVLDCLPPLLATYAATLVPPVLRHHRAVSSHRGLTGAAVADVGAAAAVIGVPIR